jgi:hypothetical protein
VGRARRLPGLTRRERLGVLPEGHVVVTGRWLAQLRPQAIAAQVEIVVRWHPACAASAEITKNESAIRRRGSAEEAAAVALRPACSTPAGYTRALHGTPRRPQRTTRRTKKKVSISTRKHRLRRLKGRQPAAWHSPIGPDRARRIADNNT